MTFISNVTMTVKLHTNYMFKSKLYHKIVNNFPLENEMQTKFICKRFYIFREQDSRLCVSAHFVTQNNKFSKSGQVLFSASKFK